MKLYSDTELDNDIRYVKDVLSRYSETYKGIGENVVQFNKTISCRICFISSQFKNLFESNQMWI